MTTHTPDESDNGTPRSSDTDDMALMAGSRVVSALRVASTRVESWVRQSTLYQWLTAEPDPEVIVIDLRETLTVGPLLRVLDWLVAGLGDAATSSRVVSLAQRSNIMTRAAPLRAVGLVTAVFGLAVGSSGLLGGVSIIQLAVGVGLAVGGLIAMQDERDWATLRETQPVTLMIAALAPPESPEMTADGEAPDQEGASQHSPTDTPQDDNVEPPDSP